MSGTPGRLPRTDGVGRATRYVLLAGIACSVALMAVGLVLALVSGDGLPRGVVPLADVPRGLAEPDAAAYLSLGLVALIATPFLRVAGALTAFARQGDRRYVAVTAIVLAVMCLSVALGRV